MYIRHVEYAGAPADSDRLTLPRLLRHACAHLKSLGCSCTTCTHRVRLGILGGSAARSLVSQSKWNWTVYELSRLASSWPLRANSITERDPKWAQSHALRQLESGRASLRQCSGPRRGSTVFLLFCERGTPRPTVSTMDCATRNLSNVRTISLEISRSQPSGRGAPINFTASGDGRVHITHCLRSYTIHRI